MTKATRLVPMYLMMVSLALLSGVSGKPKSFYRRFMTDEDGILDLSRPMSIVGTIIGAVVVVLLVAALVTVFFGAIADVNENLSDTNVTTGDDTADVILRVFPIVIGVVAVIGFVGLIIAALQFRNGGGGL